MKEKSLKPPAVKRWWRNSWLFDQMLEEERERAGLLSIYELCQGVMACYMRHIRNKRAMLLPDEENAFLDEESKEMFADSRFEEFRMSIVKSKRIPTEAEKIAYANAIGNATQLSFMDDLASTLSPMPNKTKDEINDMFCSLGEAEKHFEFTKPKRIAPNATLDSDKVGYTPQFTPLRRFARSKDFKAVPDYANEVHANQATINEQNRVFIDRFVNENYDRLNKQFDNQRETSNSKACGSIDKLNDTVLLLYTDPDLHLTSWEQAKAYLTSKFTDAAIRIPMQKPVKTEADMNEFDND